jgi:ribosomal silencing factor RsfS
MPDVDTLVNFLTVNNLTDIIVVPTKELGYNHLNDHSILSSGFTQKHVYKVAKDLIVEAKKLGIEDLKPVIYGRREDEWLLVHIGKVSVHMFVESFRKETNLLDVWMNPPTEDELTERRRGENKSRKIKY